MLDVSNMIQFKIHIIFKNLTPSSINASFSGKYFMVQALQGQILIKRKNGLAKQMTIVCLFSNRTE